MWTTDFQASNLWTTADAALRTLRTQNPKSATSSHLQGARFP
jgi:hypothetical protein